MQHNARSADGLVGRLGLGRSPQHFRHALGRPDRQRLVLGSQLHRLRESRGITAEQAAEPIRGSHSKISRMEHGRVGFKERDVADLLTLYGVTDNEERAALLNLAKEANTPGWWHAYSDILPVLGPAVCRPGGGGLGDPDLPDPVRPRPAADRGLRPGADPAGIGGLGRGDRAARRAAGQRQEILRRPDAPQLWVVVDEAALRRPVGSQEIVREQLTHLIEVADHPAVTLQIMPFSAGAHSAMGGPFTILRFAEPDLADVVYIEQLTSALYLDKPVEVDSYLEVMEQLCLQAEPVANTTKLLTRSSPRSDRAKLAPADAGRPGHRSGSPRSRLGWPRPPSTSMTLPVM